MRNPKGQFTYDYERASVTVDIAIVTKETSPRVLLIRRKNKPFAGSWALPGGFVEPDEALANAAARELREETSVEQVELEQLAAFGDPGRDPRGWTVSIAFLARVDAGVRAKAADDAQAVAWHRLDKLPKKLAFDHAKILARVRARLAAFAP